MKTNTLIFVTVALLVTGLTGAFAAGTPEEETWDLPQTGQRTTDEIGCDGWYEKGVVWEDNTRFAYVGTSVLIDNLTGLMWGKAADNTARTWAQAVAYANQSTYAGFTDWRLPNVREMRSLIHYGRDTVAWLTSDGFTGLLSSRRYWTSTTFYYTTSYAWYVHLSQGGQFVASKTNTNCVFLVR